LGTESVELRRLKLDSVSTFRAGQGNDLQFQVAGDMCLTELVFRLTEVVRVDWFSVGWLMLVS